MHCLRPAVIAEAARAFVAGFPGETLYAVKCNPEPAVLRALWAGGVRHFDCASAGRGRAGPRHVPGGRHPLHAPGQGPLGDPRGVGAPRRARLRARQRRGAGEDPRRNRRRGGRRTTSAWSCAWRCPRARPCTTCPASSARRRTTAAALLRAARPHAARLGVSFHVGSQCLEPLAWRRALALAGAVIRAAGVPVEIVDVGGGFPVTYPGVEPPAARRLLRRDRGRVRGARPAGGHRALGRAGPRAGRRRRLRGGAGARPPRRRALRERRRLRRALGCRRCRASPSRCG